jgi:hypothetical protein
MNPMSLYLILAPSRTFSPSQEVQRPLLFWTMRSRDHDVVLVSCTINLGCWEFGMGREWGGDGKGEVSLRETWGQGGRDPITPRRVSK